MLVGSFSKEFNNNVTARLSVKPYYAISGFSSVQPKDYLMNNITNEIGSHKEESCKG